MSAADVAIGTDDEGSDGQWRQSRSLAADGGDEVEIVGCGWWRCEEGGGKDRSVLVDSDRDKGGSGRRE